MFEATPDTAIEVNTAEGTAPAVEKTAETEPTLPVGPTPFPAHLKHTFIRVQGGREYLLVVGRIAWFRRDHPDWAIETEAVRIDMDAKYAIFTARIKDAEGRVLATGTKHEDVRGFGDYIEKAETGAVGRALAYLGYGTLQAQELDESAPQAPANAGRATQTPPQRQSGNFPARQSAVQPASQPQATQKNGQPAPPAPRPGRVPRPEEMSPEWQAARAEFQKTLKELGYAWNGDKEEGQIYVQFMGEKPSGWPTIAQYEEATKRVRKDAENWDNLDKAVDEEDNSTPRGEA